MRQPTKADFAAGDVAPAQLLTLARQHVDKVGVVSAAKDCGVSRQSLMALLAGLRVRRGTILLVAQALHWPGADAPASNHNPT